MARLTIPWCLVNVEMRDWVLKVANISEAASTQRAELGKDIMGAEDLLDVCPSHQPSSTVVANAGDLQPSAFPSGRVTCAESDKGHGRG